MVDSIKHFCCFFIRGLFRKKTYHPTRLRLKCIYTCISGVPQNCTTLYLYVQSFIQERYLIQVQIHQASPGPDSCSGRPFAWCWRWGRRSLVQDFFSFQKCHSGSDGVDQRALSPSMMLYCYVLGQRT
jgi:hypothetical protein